MTGLEILQETEIHLVLLDYEMPDMNGAQMLEKINRSIRNKQFFTNKAFLEAIKFVKGKIKFSKFHSHSSLFEHQAPQDHVLKPRSSFLLFLSAHRFSKVGPQYVQDDHRAQAIPCKSHCLRCACLPCSLHQTFLSNFELKSLTEVQIKC